MGSDQNPDVSGLGGSQDFLVGFALLKTGQDLNPQRYPGKAVLKVFIVLLSQQSGRYQNHDLCPAMGGQKGCPQRHFGFAEPYITTNQSIHGMRADHVGNHGVNGLLLIGRFFKRKAGNKIPIGFIRWRKSTALASCPPRVYVQQFTGGINGFLPGPGFGFIPVLTAEAR